jgi:hypothetical protein
VQPALVAVAVLASGGCTKQYVPTAKELASTTTAPPDRVGVIGERIEFAGIDVVVSDITSFERSPDGVPRLRAVIRSENVTDTERNNPVVGLRCDESDALGEWLRGSTWETGSVLPAGVVTQGELLVGFPVRPENALYTVASCTNARLRLSIGGPKTGVQVVEYSISPEVVAESIDRPRGRPLPLPLETR